MTDSVRLALALMPLAIYFFVLGSWQGGRRPKMVAGPVDAGLLTFGLGSLIAFGPVGRFAVDSLFPAPPSVWAWLTMASVVVMAGLILTPRASHRLVIYQVSSDDLRRAVEEALAGLGGTFAATVTGFEDRDAGRGVTIETGARLKFGVVEAYGQHREGLIALLAPPLQARLREVRSTPSRLGTFWVVLGSLTLAAPLSSFLMGGRSLSTAIRVLWHRLRGA